MKPQTLLLFAILSLASCDSWEHKVDNRVKAVLQQDLLIATEPNRYMVETHVWLRSDNGSKQLLIYWKNGCDEKDLSKQWHHDSVAAMKYVNEANEKLSKHPMYY